MARRGGIVLAAALLAVLILPALPAAAGGGCHSGATQGNGDTVAFEDACFTPSTLRIDPGDTVTFVNRDDFTHNVGGNLWGHYEDMNLGDAFRATFDRPGIFPYACSYHPGMTGAIVVGDGSGPGNGEVVTVEPFEQPAASPVVQVRTVTEDASGTPIAIGWIVGAALGLGIGVGAGLLLRGSRSAG